MNTPKLRSRILVFIIFIAVVFVLMAWMGPTLGTTRPNFPSIHDSGARVVDAIERYQRNHGTLPPDLNALVPDYLPRIDKVPYARKMAYHYPHKLFDRDVKSPWAYKLSHDKTSFALAVEAKPTFFYDSQSARWRMGDESFAGYEKPPATPRQKF